MEPLAHFVDKIINILKSEREIDDQLFVGICARAREYGHGFHLLLFLLFNGCMQAQMSIYMSIRVLHMNYLNWLVKSAEIRI